MEPSDWTLYYSQEGYPYYFNAKTGESQWAEYDYTADYSQNQYQSNEQNQTAAVENDEEDEDEDEDEEEEDDSDEGAESGSDEESNDEERQAKVVDRILEEKFKQFLRTPEGMAAMEAEQARVSKALEKKERKRNIELEKDYVRDLQKSKKEDDSRPKVVQPSLLGGIFSYVESAATYLSSKKPAESTSGKSNKSKSKSKNSDVATTATATDDQKRQQTTHRKPHSSTTPREEDNVESGAGADDRSTRSESSLSSSDHGSVSSDDSDIVTINAPFMSEFANYLTLTSLHANYVAPVNEYLTEHNVYDNTATVVQNVSTATVNVLSNVTSATLTITQQGLFYTGAGLLSAFSLLFERLNPVLLNFMRSVVDSGNANGSDPATPRIAESNSDGSIEGGTGSNAAVGIPNSSRSGSGLYDGGVSPHTKKSSKSSKSSKHTPTSSPAPPSGPPAAAGLGTPRAPTTPRTPRGLPPGYSGGLLPTARVEGVSSVASTPYGTPAMGKLAGPPTSAGGPTVTWKVFEDDGVRSTDNTPVKGGAAETSAVDVSVLTEATGGRDGDDNEDEEEEEEEGVAAANTSYISSQSAHPHYEEVYSAPPTPRDGLLFHSNPIKLTNVNLTSSGNAEENADEGEESESVAPADTSYISSQSAHPHYEEVYSAPPTPGNGLLFHSNPIRQADPAAVASTDDDNGDDAGVEVDSSPVKSEEEVKAGAESHVEVVEATAEIEAAPKSLESEFNEVDEPSAAAEEVEASAVVDAVVDTAVDLKDIALGEETVEAPTSTAEE